MRDGCPFCDYEGPSAVIEELRSTYVIEPINPVAPGHVLVIPYRHADCFWSDPLLAGKAVEDAALYAARHGGHWNLIASAGEAATQTVQHLHVHLVPRRRGDGLLLPWSAAGAAG